MNPNIGISATRETQNYTKWRKLSKEDYHSVTLTASYVRIPEHIKQQQIRDTKLR
jgi:hypothetical protein